MREKSISLCLKEETVVRQVVLLNTNGGKCPSEDSDRELPGVRLLTQVNEETVVETSEATCTQVPY